MAAKKTRRSDELHTAVLRAGLGLLRELGLLLLGLLLHLVVVLVRAHLVQLLGKSPASLDFLAGLDDVAADKAEIAVARQTALALEFAQGADQLLRQLDVDLRHGHLLRAEALGPQLALRRLARLLGDAGLFRLFVALELALDSLEVEEVALADTLLSAHAGCALLLGLLCFFPPLLCRLALLGLNRLLHCGQSLSLGLQHLRVHIRLILVLLFLLILAVALSMLAAGQALGHLAHPDLVGLGLGDDARRPLHNGLPLLFLVLLDFDGRGNQALVVLVGRVVGHAGLGQVDGAHSGLLWAARRLGQVDGPLLCVGGPVLLCGRQLYLGHSVVFGPVVVCVALDAKGLELGLSCEHARRVCCQVRGDEPGAVLLLALVGLDGRGCAEVGLEACVHVQRLGGSALLAPKNRRAHVHGVLLRLGAVQHKELVICLHRHEATRALLVAHVVQMLLHVGEINLVTHVLLLVAGAALRALQPALRDAIFSILCKV
eukprot:m.102775 g.102775  ORF g.102775 m.102775 type:complete len:489 (-) comp15701_c1_seq3:38-1504(-)